MGTKNLHEILSDRESISGSMQVINSPLFYLKDFNSKEQGEEERRIINIYIETKSFSFSFQSVLDEATTAWGIKVERVEM